MLKMKPLFCKLLVCTAAITGFVVATVMAEDQQPWCTTEKVEHGVSYQMMDSQQKDLDGSLSPQFELMEEYWRENVNEKLLQLSVPEPGIHQWRTWKACQRLQYICPALASGNLSKSEANRLPWGIEHDTCPGGNTTKFCALNNKCIPSAETCDLTSLSNALNGSAAIPCGGNCSSVNESYCSLLDRCIPKSESCSLKKLIDWVEAGNKTFGPYGKICATNTTYCLAQWSCTSASETCAINTSPLTTKNLTLNDSMCNSKHKTFCRAAMECIPKQNNTNLCEQTSTNLNFTAAEDYGTGWKTMCEYKEAICRPRLAGAVRCTVPLQHCFCGDGKYYCKPKASCIANTSHCCELDEKWCLSENRCKSNISLCCDPPTYLCNVTNQCLHPNTSCNGTCLPGLQFCPHPGSCLNSSKPCPCATGYFYCNDTHECKADGSLCGNATTGVASSTAPPPYNATPLSTIPAPSASPELSSTPALSASPAPENVPASSTAAVPPNIPDSSSPLPAPSASPELSSPPAPSASPAPENVPASSTAAAPPNIPDSSSPLPAPSASPELSSTPAPSASSAPENVPASSTVAAPSSIPASSSHLPSPSASPAPENVPASSTAAVPPNIPDSSSPLPAPSASPELSSPPAPSASPAPENVPASSTAAAPPNIPDSSSPLPAPSASPELSSTPAPSASSAPENVPASSTVAAPSSIPASSSHLPSPSASPAPESAPASSTPPVPSTTLALSTTPVHAKAPTNMNQSLYQVVSSSKLLGSYPNIFQQANDTIAVASLLSCACPGELQYYHADTKVWQTVTDLRRDNALIQGRNNSLRFVQYNKTCHGMVLLNYTARSGTVGQRVLLDASEYEDEQTIVLFVLPRVTKPELTLEGDYSVDEDSFENKFLIKDKIQLKADRVSCDLKLDKCDDIQDRIAPHQFEAYKRFIGDICKQSPFVALCGVDEDPIDRFGGCSECRGKDGECFNLTSQNLTFGFHKHDKFFFTPKPEYNGQYYFKFSGAYGLPLNGSTPTILWSLPYNVRNYWMMLHQMKKFGGDVIKQAEAALAKLQSENKKLTESNLLDVLRSLHSEASGQEGLAVATERATQLTLDAYRTVRQLNLSVDAMSTTFTQCNDTKYIVAAYCETPINFTGPVVPQNDPPKILAAKSEIRFDFEYNTTANQVECRNVGNITNGVVTDKDGHLKGLAVTRAFNKTHYGRWKIRCNGSTEDLVVSNKGSNSDKVNCYLLKPSCCIKFEPNGSIVWGAEEAEMMALDAHAWDGSDGRGVGPHKCSVPPNETSSLSKGTFEFRPRKKGCDGKFGSMQTQDRCGVCGGFDDCLGCDGQPNSGAVIDQCGNCTNGTTNVLYNSGLDCTGQTCGQAHEDSCGVCQSIANPINVTTCDGVCFGNASINSCGYCTGGNTSLPATHGMDACGVCGGDNSSCTDCEGVVNGGKTNDSCGDCKLETDATFNTGCIKLFDAQPGSGPITGGSEITVKGAGLGDKQTAHCKFTKNQISVAAEATSIQTRPGHWIFKVTSPVFTEAGPYNLSCTFNSEAASYQVEGQTFYFYDKSKINITGNSPIEVEVGCSPFNVTINGTGFVNSGYIKCVDESENFKTEGYFVSTTQVTCFIPTFDSSKELTLTVEFSEPNNQAQSRRRRRSVAAVAGVKLTVFVYPPDPKSAAMENDLFKIVISLSKEAGPASEEESGNCSLYIDLEATNCTFGEGAQCNLRKNIRIVVFFGDDSDCKPGDVIAVKRSSVKAFKERITKRTAGLRLLPIEEPSNPPSLDVKIKGGDSYGPCAEIDLECSVAFGDGGRSVVYKWTVRTPAGESDQIPDKTAIQTLLDANTGQEVTLDKDKVKINYNYEFVCEVTNFLGRKKTATFMVKRENKNIPSLEVPKSVSALASSPFTIEARVKMSPCLNRDDPANEMEFEWVPLNFKLPEYINKKLFYLYIEGRRLIGGKGYRTEVKAYMKNNPSLSITEVVSIEVVSAPLVAVIAGGDITVSETGKVTFDGSDSYDPDGDDSVKANYLWQCFNAKGQPLMNGKNRLTLPRKEVIQNFDVRGIMKADKTYKCSLTYSKGRRSDTAYVTIDIVRGEPPLVGIPTFNTLEKEDPKAKIRVLGVVFSTQNKEILCQWESLCISGKDCIDLSKRGVALTEVSSTIGKDKKFVELNLVIAPRKLKPGTSYRFSLKCNYKGSSSTGRAGTDKETNSPPKRGKFKVTPANGTAMTTKFDFDAKDGWADAKEDGPLQFTFGCQNEDDDIELYTGKNRGRGGFTLPAGQFECFVRVADRHGAESEKTFKVTVEEKVFNEDEVNGFVNDAEKLLRSGDADAAIANFVGVATVLQKSATIAAAKKTEILGKVCSKYLEKDPPREQKQTKKYAKNLMKLTEGQGKSFTVVLKEQVIDRLLRAYNYGTSTTPNSKRRRREVNTPAKVEAKTATDVKTLLAILSNLIKLDEYDSDTMTQKSTYVSTVDKSGQSMCAGLVSGEPAIVADDVLAAVRSEKNNFNSVDAVYIDMACTACPKSVKSTAKMLLGTALKASYQSWNCASGKQCSGVCVVSSQYPYDLVRSSSVTELELLTNIVDLKLYNPATYSPIQLSSLSSPVTLRIPLDYKNTTEFVKGTTRFECKRWVSSQWTGTGCTTTDSLVTVNSTDYVECKCTDFGFVAAFIAPPLTTTAPPSTQPVSPVKIQFKLEGNYDEIVTANNKAAVKASVTSSIVKTTTIEASQIVNLTLSAGSIQVTFMLISNSNHTTDAAILAQANQLKDAFNSGFQVTLPDGTNITAVPNSFVIGEGTVSTTAAPTPAAQDGGLTDTEMIVIAVVCSLVAVALIIIIVIIVKKKNRERKVWATPRESGEFGSPDDKELSVQGRHNPGLDDSSPGNSRKRVGMETDRV